MLGRDMLVWTADLLVRSPACCYCAGRSVPGRADKERLRAGEAGHSRDIVTSFLFWEIITSPAALPALLGYEAQPHHQLLIRPQNSP